MSKPRLLDLFSGAGGAAVGYHRAGFEVVGVDIKPQPRYPFAFVRMDALRALDELDYALAMRFGKFDAIHASPPCQAYSTLRSLQPGKAWPDLLAPTRERLLSTGVPWVIENVMGAPLTHGVVLCGGMFGLRTYRHRQFESNLLMWQPEHPKHVAKTSTRKTRKDYAAGMHISVTGDFGDWVGAACMGIDWMKGREIAEAIPPAYSEWIGRQLMQALVPA